MKVTFCVATCKVDLVRVEFPCRLIGSVCSVLRPVWVARLVSQVEDVASYVVLCGDIRQYPRFIGSSHLQAAYRTVSALPTPAETEGSVWWSSITFSVTKELLDYSSLWAIISPFINAFLTEAVCTGQNEVRLSVHADTTLLLVSQLLHSAPTHKQRTDKVLLLFLRKKSTDLKEGGKKRKIVFWLKCLISEESWSLVIKRSAWEKYHSVI